MSELAELPKASDDGPIISEQTGPETSVQAAMKRLKLPEEVFKRLLLDHHIKTVDKSVEKTLPIMTTDDLSRSLGKIDSERAFTNVVSLTAYVLGEAWVDTHPDNDKRREWRKKLIKENSDTVTINFLSDYVENNQLAGNSISKPILGLQNLANVAKKNGKTELAKKLEELNHELYIDFVGDKRDGGDDYYDNRPVDEKLKTIRHVELASLEALNMLATKDTPTQVINIT